MVTDTELVNRLHEFLRTADLDNTTTASVRRTLEKDLGIDLSDRKAFIREKIDLFLETHNQKTDNPQNDDAVDTDDGSEEQVADAESDDGEEEEEDDESNGKRPKKSDKEVKKIGRGFSKPCALSPQLQKLVGAPELARTEVVKKIWVYIKANNLQKPSDKRKIICDEILHDIFRVKSINMFQMNKALTKHIWPLDEEEAPVKPSKNKRRNKEDTDEEEESEQESEDEDEEKVEAAPVKPSKNKRRNKEDTDEEEESEQESEDEDEEKEEAPAKSIKKKKRNKDDTEEEEDSDAPKGKRKQVKGKGSGFLSPVPISDALGKFFETDDRALSRADVIKRMWEYIKRNNLQDPSDKRRILCDDKLKELFKVKTFIGFTVSKLLTSHFIKEA